MDVEPAILVTGGAGYIGSHTCKALVGAGMRPVVLDDLSTGHREAVRWGPLIEGDCGDPALVGQVIRDHAICACIHFAAKAYVGESMANPRKYYERNVGVTLALLGALLDDGIGTVVFSSTCATYGVPERLPITEATPQRPINPYGETKLVIERAMHWYAQAHGLRWCALRYFNACGADPGGEIGERHDPETHLIPLAIAAALGLGPGLKVFGDDFPTPDGTAVRDYIHVADLADAHVRALRGLLGGELESGAMNLGTGRGTSVLEIIDTVGAVGSTPVPHEIVGRRRGDPAELVADPARAHARLGWRAAHSIRASVEHAWCWHRAHG